MLIDGMSVYSLNGEDWRTNMNELGSDMLGKGEAKAYGEILTGFLQKKFRGDGFLLCRTGSIKVVAYLFHEEGADRLALVHELKDQSIPTA